MPSLLARVSPFLIMTAALILTPATACALPPAADIDHQIAAAGARLELLDERYDTIKADLYATRARIAVASARLTILAMELSGKRSQMSAMVVWAYKSTPVDLASGVLGADSPPAFLGRLASLEWLARAHGQDILQLTTLRSHWDRQRQDWQHLAVLQARRMAELKALTLTARTDLTALQRLRAQLATGAPGTIRAGPGDHPQQTVPSYSPVDASKVVSFAYRQIGKPYVFGAAGPSAYDCSGLTMASWMTIGVSLPHNAARQFATVAHIARSALRPGDLVFYYAGIHHVALYVGQGQVIHAPSPGQTVQLHSIDMAPIYGYGRP
jgi:peptidoglycan DL-endopeptidase CwlO